MKVSSIKTDNSHIEIFVEEDSEFADQFSFLLVCYDTAENMFEDILETLSEKQIEITEDQKFKLEIACNNLLN